MDEVGVWLEMLCLSEYKEIFIRHDIRGPELLQLERRDLKVSALTLWQTHTFRCISCVVIQEFSKRAARGSWKTVDRIKV